MAHLDNLRGERENRRTKRGIRKRTLGGKVVRHPSRHATPTIHYRQRRPGKNLRRKMERVYKGV